MTEPYQPCAYLLEGLPPGATGTDTDAFQYSIAADLPRLIAADGWSLPQLQVWLQRCRALGLRPHLLLVAADSPLAVTYTQLRAYAPDLADTAQWLFWPPQPQAVTRVLRDPDDAVLEVLAAAFNGAAALPRGDGDLPAAQAALLTRVASWLQQHGEGLADSLGVPPPTPLQTAAALHRLRDWLRQSATATPLPPRRVLLDEPLLLLAASHGGGDAPLRRTSPDGSWSVSNEHIPGDADSQFLVFRCDAAAARRWQGCEVEIQIETNVFTLGAIDRQGIAELRISRRIDLRQLLQVRIVQVSD